MMLGLLGATAVTAHPHHSVNPTGQSVARRGIDLTAFAPPARASYINSEGTESNKESLKLHRRATYVETASSLVKETVPGVQFRVVEDHYVGTNGVAHVNFKQTVNGIDIDNADFNVNVRTLQLPEIYITLCVTASLTPTRSLPMAPSCPTATASTLARSLPR